MTAIPEPLSARFVESFAYITVKDRLPVILTKVIDMLFRERDVITQQYKPTDCSSEELKKVIGMLSKMKNELQTDKPLSDLQDSRSDIDIWNKSIEEERQKVSKTDKPVLSWYNSPWLFMETYFYRRIQEPFELSTILRNLDPFRQQKEDGMITSVDAALPLARYLEQVLQKLPITNSSELEDLFNKLVQVNLWGNRCDLSISCGTDNSQKDDPLVQVDKFKPNILVNHSKQLWEILNKNNSEKHSCLHLSFILDNSGFELFTDFCLADFLCSAKIVNKVTFYVKTFPWYVSDTTLDDFNWVLQFLTGSHHSELKELGSRWQKFVSEGTWLIEEEQFWTQPFDYSRMKDVDPNLYNKLGKSDLLIFKGDLNYRKLTGDLKWDYTTPFEVSLRGFHPAPLCSLRTLKADVVVGLNPGQGEATERLQSNWLVSGDFAVIQYSGQRDGS